MKELIANEIMIVVGGVSASAVISGMADGATAGAAIGAGVGLYTGGMAGAGMGGVIGGASGAMVGAAAVFYDDWGNSDIPDQSQPMYKMGDGWYIGY